MKHSLLPLLVLAALEESSSWTVHSDSSIKAASQSYALHNAPSACRCRMRCFADSLCQAVSVIQGASPGAISCAFLQKSTADESPAQPSTYLRDQPGARTFVKESNYEFVCEAPNVQVEEVGCLFISSNSMTQTAAKSKGCPNQMKLYAPPSEAVFFKLADFLKNGGYEEDYWIWLERLPNNTWVWEDGKYVYGTDVYEKGVWGTGNPSTENCAKMRESSGFKLSDRACDEDYRYICGMA